MRNDAPAKPSDMKVGVRVKCIFRFSNTTEMERTGKTGTVIAVGDGRYTIKWDDNSTVDLYWSEAKSFTILPDQTSVEVIPPAQEVSPTITSPATDPPFDFDAYNRGDMIKREA